MVFMSTLVPMATTFFSTQANARGKTNGRAKYLPSIQFAEGTRGAVEHPLTMEQLSGYDGRLPQIVPIVWAMPKTRTPTHPP